MKAERDVNLDTAVNILSEQGNRLRDLAFRWDDQTQQAAYALRFRARAASAGASVPALVGIVGGASSGKSTVFNNLLGGRRASLVTIKSHATRGLILAAHRDRASQLELWLHHERTLLPSLVARAADRQTDLQGEPRAAVLLQHDEEPIRDVLIADTPDFTSNAAEREGDLTMAVLPWFDRLVIVVDHERWFDRQVIDDLGQAASRFGQQRMVVFNRTVQGDLGESDRKRLDEQARQLQADRTLVLNYYAGRGFRRFDSEVVADLTRFLSTAGADRGSVLRAHVADRAAGVLDMNRRRLDRLERLHRTLSKSAERLTPVTWWECVTAMMSPQERERLDSFSRLLGLSQMRDWMDRQRKRFEQTMSKMQWFGMSGSAQSIATKMPAETFSREQSGLDFFEAQCEQQRRRLNEDVRGSEFWDDLRRTAGRDPVVLGPAFTESFAARARRAVDELGEALQAWDAKVQRECQGVSVPVAGSLGMTLIGIAAILVAVPGPLTALTPIIAAGAIEAGLVKIGAAGLLGWVGGRSVARLVEIVREQLLASPEFNAVNTAAESLRLLVDEHGQSAARELEQSARNLTLPAGDSLLAALEVMARSKA